MLTKSSLREMIGSPLEWVMGAEEPSHLNKVFDVKDLGTLKSFLGREVARSKSGIFISQRKYTMGLVLTILQLF